MITFHQRIFAVIASSILVGLILFFVYKRQIKERYSWLWLLTGAGIFLLAVWYDLLLFVMRLIGAYSPQTTLFLCGLIFLIIINIHFSIRISKLYDQMKMLVQTIAILGKKINDLQDTRGNIPPNDKPNKPARQ